jgi:hypothetical protein
VLPAAFVVLSSSRSTSARCAGEGVRRSVGSARRPTRSPYHAWNSSSLMTTAGSQSHRRAPQSLKHPQLLGVSERHRPDCRGAARRCAQRGDSAAITVLARQNPACTPARARSPALATISPNCHRKEPSNAMLDQLRQQIQTHLDELLGEADKLRRALGALGLRDGAATPSASAAPAPAPERGRPRARSASASRTATRRPARPRSSASSAATSPSPQPAEPPAARRVPGPRRGARGLGFDQDRRP